MDIYKNKYLKYKKKYLELKNQSGGNFETTKVAQNRMNKNLQAAKNIMDIKNLFEDEFNEIHRLINDFNGTLDGFKNLNEEIIANSFNVQEKSEEQAQLENNRINNIQNTFDEDTFKILRKKCKKVVETIFLLLENLVEKLKSFKVRVNLDFTINQKPGEQYFDLFNQYEDIKNKIDRINLLLKKLKSSLETENFQVIENNINNLKIINDLLNMFKEQPKIQSGGILTKNDRLIILKNELKLLKEKRKLNLLLRNIILDMNKFSLNQNFKTFQMNNNCSTNYKKLIDCFKNNSNINFNEMVENYSDEKKRKILNFLYMNYLYCEIVNKNNFNFNENKYRKYLLDIVFLIQKDNEQIKLKLQDNNDNKKNEEYQKSLNFNNEIIEKIKSIIDRMI